jgi:hypothetical protein
METLSEANLVDELMNMSINMDRLPKEMMASVTSQYKWEGMREMTRSQLSETHSLSI